MTSIKGDQHMPRAYALTRSRLSAAAKYVSEHLAHSCSGTPMVADLYETPNNVVRTLTRIYGRPRIPFDGETAYWIIDDGGRRLGIECA